jgi:hypothetical protein
MRTLASMTLVAVIAVALAGCSTVDRRYGRYSDRDYRDPQCREGGGGRVDLHRWQTIVDDFLTSEYRGREEFQRAKRQLLDDLYRVRDRACGWERRDVERLWEQVRNFRYRDAWD